MSNGIAAVITVVAGIAAFVVVYWLLDRGCDLLPRPWNERLKPYAYLAPALAAIGIFLLYPTVLTIVDSLKGPSASKFVGLANYEALLKSSDFRQTLLNTLLWIILVPFFSIVVGLAVAILTDRLFPRAEKAAKTLIFLPMAVSAAGASTIWRFIYAANPPGQPQVGLLNGIAVGLGFKPIPWLTERAFHANSMLLMVMMLWMQVGFSMVLISAAIKAVPAETLEAARIDGANERQIFFRVIVPQIWGTVVTVFITVLIGVMKVFDIVYVMTDGSFNTNVVGVEFYNQLYTNFNNGYATAIVVMLMVATVPIMIYQARHFRAQEELR